MNTSTRPFHTHHRILLGLGLSTAAVLAFAVAGRAQAAGTLDDNFNSNGKVTVAFTEGGVRGYGLAPRGSTGEIYLGGWLNGDDAEQIALVRVHEDGELDNGFSGNGMALGDFGQDFARGYRIIRNDATGRITVVGQTSAEQDGDETDGVTTNLGVAQFEATGLPNDAFGTNGATHFNFNTGVDDKGWDLVEQPDGKILVVGWTMNGANMNYAVARLNADGSLDNSFSTNGQVEMDFNGNNDFARAVALQPDGKILVAGTSFANTAGDNQRFSIMRLLPNGILDDSFDTNGKREIVSTNSPSTECWDIAVQPDGKIVLAGYEAGLACLSRLNADGSSDLAFGTLGTLTFEDSPGAGATFHCVALQADNKILAAGYDGSIDASNILLARFLPDGTPDSDFGSNGSVTESFATGIYETARDIYIQPDNKIVLGGSTIINDIVQFVLLRYHAGAVCWDGAIASGAIPTDVACNGESTGDVNLSVSPSDSYTYDWSNGATSQDLINVPAGVYSVVIVNSDGCSEVETVTITEPPALSATWSTTDEWSGGDGAINLTVSGGTPSYSYAWSNGSTSQDINGLSGGTYSVEVTDENGCISEYSIVVESTVGVSEARANADWSAFFDPRSGQVAIRAFRSAERADLFDMGGTMVRSIRLVNGAGQLPAQDLSSGVYCVRLYGQVQAPVRRVPIIH